MSANIFTYKDVIAQLTVADEAKAKEIARLSFLEDAKSKQLIEKDQAVAEKIKQLAEKDQVITDLKSREDSLLAVRSAMDGASAAIMMINRDFIVTYVNKASVELFSNNMGEFRAAFPSFDPAKIIGTCIDVFHKRPEHQRQMLANTSLLPFKTNIKVGSLTIALYVTATYDQHGKHTGNVLEWRDVTADLAKATSDLDAVGQLAAINKAMGVIEFDLTGKILAVNANFANVTGYSPSEIIGNHHSMFVEPTYRTSFEYKSFWEKLGRGEADSGQYKRIGRGGREIWLEATYNPIMDASGKAFKVVKYATDITQAKMQAADYSGQIAAIGKSQGVIEFTLDGKVLTVNDIFLNIMGYSLSEAVGQHHSIFVDPAFRSSAEYRMFWEKLGRGEFESGQFRRIAKGGREVWLQASYNPILDMNGKPFKVVKYAADITDQIHAQQVLASAVQETQEVVSAAKAGDLTERIPLEGKTGSIQELCDGVNSLVDNMAEIITQIKESGETINTAATEISAGNNDLSQRTEEQASSLEETASSMEELASTVKQNAENAKQANQLAAAASGVAVKGGTVVGEVVNTMSAINDSSRKIVDIISVIDGIAFQTNILALNAAVEAARAGEQGRGFAVVAGEVRNLAQRSAAAAKEIKQLISDSVEKVQGGTKLVEEAGKTMEEIVSSVKRVTDIMGEIAAASAEQSDGIDQVNGAITQMDEVTQQNAALVEQAAAAAESLVEQANTLMDAVSVFKVANEPVSKNVKRLPAPSTSRAVTNSTSRVAKPKPVSRPVKKNANEDEWEEF